MAPKYERGGSKTGTNVNGGAPKINRYTKTGARKYYNKDQVKNNEPGVVGAISNDEHMVIQASGLKTLSMVGQSAAAEAREAIVQTRDRLTKIRQDFPKDRPRGGPSLNDDDIQNARRDAVVGIMDRLDISEDDPMHKRLSQLAKNTLEGSSDSFLVDRSQGSATNQVNLTIPEIDYIAIEMHKKRGTTDCFFARLVFSVPADQVRSKNIRAFRIFKSSIVDPVFTRDVGRLSIYAVDRMMSQPNMTRVKNQDYAGLFENRLKEGGIDNSISALSPRDGVRKRRTASDRAATLSVPPAPANYVQDGDGRNAQNLKSWVFPDGLAHVDTSVTTDLRTLRNIKLQSPHLTTYSNADGIPVGKNVVVNQRLGNAQLRERDRNMEKGLPSLIVDRNNSQEFRQIAFLSPEKLRRQIVGDYFEYSFDDEAVNYGRGYRYYIVSVDHNMRESTRSQFVEVTIDGLRVPDAPDRVNVDVLGNYASIATSVGDQLVEKFEIYRKEMNPGVYKPGTSTFDAISGGGGFTRETTNRLRGANQYMQVQECLNIPGKGGSSFLDRTTLPGHRYSYRIYSVDIFGNKSESPKEVSVYVPDPHERHVELRKPSLLAEVDSQSNQVTLTFSCDDPRVEALLLTRCDLTLGQSAFTVPGGVNLIHLGQGDVRGPYKFLDARLNDTDTDTAWPGYFQNDLNEQIFTDTSAVVDHSYQYKMVGIDRYGNSTTAEITPPLRVVDRSFVESPVGLSGSVIANGNAIDGISLKWKDSIVSVSAEEMVGPQNSSGSLNDTSVRTLFQLERRKVGEDNWFSYQMISGTSYFDPAVGAGRKAPDFAPPLVELHETYVYRVQAFLSGGSISNFATPIRMFVGVPPLPPNNFRVRPGDVKVRPLYVMLNWDTDRRSGVIDSWEIERAVVNNFAASRMNSKNPEDFLNLKYVPFRRVYFESSRFQSATSARNNNLNLDPAGAITGQHCYMDMNIQLGNSYFYRIRAMSIDGRVSDWSFRGMKMSEEVFDRKLDSILSNGEKVLLSNNFDSLSLKTGLMFSKLENIQTSFGFQPASEKVNQPPGAVRPIPSINFSYRHSPKSGTSVKRVLTYDPGINRDIGDATYKPFNLDDYGKVKRRK